MIKYVFLFAVFFTVGKYLLFCNHMNDQVKLKNKLTEENYFDTPVKIFWGKLVYDVFFIFKAKAKQPEHCCKQT